MNAKTRNVLIKYTVATVGMFLVAVGVALSIISNLGTAPLSCPSYLLNLWRPVLSVGTWTLIVNCSYLFVQLAVFRSKFKAKYLMQIIASALFGYLIDASLWLFAWLQPTGWASRLAVNVAAAAVTAVGVSIEVVARAWMLSAEMTVYSISKTFALPFNKVKIAMDSLLVVLSVVGCQILFGSPLGSGDLYVFGVGTLILAVLPGWLMKFTDPLADSMMDRIFARIMGIS